MRPAARSRGRVRWRFRTEELRMAKAHQKGLELGGVATLFGGAARPAETPERERERLIVEYTRLVDETAKGHGPDHPVRFRVSPLFAQWLLELSAEKFQNRPLAQKHVEALRRAIDAEQMFIQESNILVHTIGYVGNGYHRLTACAGASRSFDAFFRFGCTDDEIRNADQGRPRDARGRRVMMGVDTHPMWVAVVTSVRTVTEGRASTSNLNRGDFVAARGGNIQLFELEAVYEKHKASIDWAIEALGGKKIDGSRRRFSSPIVGAFALVHDVLPVEAARSAEKLVTQMSDRPDCAMKKLRALACAQTKSGEDGRWMMLRQALRCIQADVEGEGLQYMQKKGPDVGLDWLLALRAKAGR